MSHKIPVKLFIIVDAIMIVVEYTPRRFLAACSYSCFAQLPSKGKAHIIYEFECPTRKGSAWEVCLPL